MKKKLLIAISLFASVFTSCNMDLAPIGVLNDEDALNQYSDLLYYRNGFYSTIRGFNTGGFYSTVELQADMFNGLVINGNRGGTIANGVIQPSDGDITDYWAGCYGNIASINFFLQKAEPVYQAAVEKQDEKALEISRFIIEARFFRAYFYAVMFDRWCQLYTPDKGDTPGLGLPIVTVYDPTSDRSKYPSRSTMNETIKFINDEFDFALKGLEEYEAINAENIEPMAIYLNSYIVKAMKARFALWIGDNQAAYDLAEDIIKNGPCTLSTRNNYTNMWTKDTNSEILFEPYESLQELSGQYGATWNSTDVQQTDYIPASNVIAALAEAGMDTDAFGRVTGYKDARGTAFLANRDLSVNAVIVKSPIFNKYMGNPELQSGNLNLCNKAKPFRLSEMYFIAMEASAALNQPEEANRLLNDYMSKRVKGYTEKTLSGNELVQTIRRQRGLEFMGEGFRLSDLRRWNQGFDRSAGTHYESAEVAGILVNAGTIVSYQGDDYRYTWPIPSDEIQSNPQMAGQQNPGY